MFPPSLKRLPTRLAPDTLHSRVQAPWPRTAVSMGVLLLGGVLHAAAHAEGLVVLPKIEVTGSHIPRIEAQTSSPTQIIRREEIRRTGATTVRELIDSLSGSSQLVNAPNGTRSLSDITANNNSYAAGSSSASLRHLGPQATLVLLNSRRLAPFAMDDDPGMFPNLDTLPLDAIERVEILRSGASAIYGSDAVAGVINIITRRDHQGVELRASHEQSTAASAFKNSSVALTAGFGDLATDRYNLLVNVELYKRNAVTWGEVLGGINPEALKYAPSFGSASTYSNPGNIVEAGGALPGCDPAKIVDGYCMFDRYGRLQAQPSSERANLLVSGQLNFAPQLDGFAELLYSSIDTRLSETYQYYGKPQFTTWFDPSTGRSRMFISRGLPLEHPLNTTGVDDVDFRYRFTDVEPEFTVKSSNYRLLTGLRGIWQGFDWQSAVGTMGGTSVNRQRGFFSDSGFKAVIGDYNHGLESNGTVPVPRDPLFFNRAYRIGQPNSAEVLNALFPSFEHVGRINQTFVDGRMSGPVGSLGGRPIDMAFGFDLRRESLTITPSANLASGDIVGFGVATTDAKRSFGSLFTEANLPVTERLEVQAAARLDKYPGFSANLSPKLGLRFEATSNLMFRATIENGFRAPNLTENAESTRYTFDPVTDPKRCPQARALADDLYVAAAALPDGDPMKAQYESRAAIVTAQECGRNVAAVRSSNPALEPEKAVSSTLGLVIVPADGYLASLDYWHISRRNEIGYKTAQALVNAEDTLPAGVVVRSPFTEDASFTPAERTQYGVNAGSLSAAYSTVENTSRTSTSGLDLALQSRTRTAWGVLTTGAQSSVLLSYYRYSSFLGGYGDNLAGRYNFPRLRASVSAALANGPTTHALRMNYTGSTKLQADYDDTSYSDQSCLDGGWSIGDCRVRRFITFDYFFQYTGVRDLSIGLNVRNLLNTRPPVDYRALGESGGDVIPQDIRDVQRRTVRLTLGYKFL
ncbi:MAG: hypothetical protein RLZZ618_2505 [Pseudomonadota bacterium]|jgi:iron complex outermembrane receptor protein